MYLTIFGISLGAWILLEVWVFFRDRGSAGDAASGEARRTISILAIAVALAMNVPGIAPMLDVHKNYAVYFFCGIAFVWLGMLLRLWCIRTLGKFFSPRLVLQEGHQLITTGPYRFLRNPAYTGGLLTIIGLGVSLGNGASVALLLAAALAVYIPRIRAEEKMLAGAFEARFEAYKKGTWALIPFVW
jgi:protein-S-isoprenylcysteine O-methyltransferase